MSPTAVRFAFVSFALLTGAMATNIFVLQPPSRLASLPPARDTGSGTASGWSARTNAPSNTAEVAAKPGSPVPPLETAALRPIAEIANRSDLVKAVQRELKSKGYETGTVDGVSGLVTRGAIMAYEEDAGLPLTAEPRQALLQHLVLGSAGNAATGAAGKPPGPEAENVIRAVQRAFRQLGYVTTLPDGRLNDSTRRAIRKFEQDRKLKETGRISGELIAKLASLASDAMQASVQ